MSPQQPPSSSSSPEASSSPGSSSGGPAAGDAQTEPATRGPSVDELLTRSAELDEREGTIAELERVQRQHAEELGERERAMAERERNIAAREAAPGAIEPAKMDTRPPAARSARAEIFYRGRALVIPRAAFLAHGPCEVGSFNARANEDAELVYPAGLDQSTEEGVAELRELAERNPGGLLWLAHKRLIPVTRQQAEDAVREVHGVVRPLLRRIA